MTQSKLNDVLWHLRKACEAETVRDLTDAELLERFLSLREETAFALLVQRHGPMVLSVCQRILQDRHAAEDAFQATFLVLVQKAASIRKSSSLASWLYGVAQRIARKTRVRNTAQRSRERRSEPMPRAETLDELTWQELRAVLDEEIHSLPERYRAPIILCYLEGKSYNDAARELGWPKSSLAGSLGRARKILQGRLAHRGIALSAAALAAGLTERVTGAPLPALLLINTVKGATLVAAGKAALGPLTAQAIALGEESMKGMLGFKGKVVLLLLTAGLAAGGFGLANPQRPGEKPSQDKQAAARSDPLPPSSSAPERVGHAQEKRMVRGTVLRPDGKPATNATIIRRQQGRKGKTIEDTTLARTGPDGRFEVEHKDTTVLIASAPGFAPDWTGYEFQGGDLTLRLAERALLRGQLVDLEGKPVAGARVKVLAVKIPAEGNLQAVVDAFRLNPEWISLGLPKQLYDQIPSCPTEAKTDTQGKFELEGFGKNWVVELRFEADRIEAAPVHVILANDFDPKSVLPSPAERAASMSQDSRSAVYGPKFIHPARPCHVITGTVTDDATGKPIPDIKVVGTATTIRQFSGGAWDDAVETVTDQEGKYRLTGLPKAKTRHLHLQAGEAPYLDRLIPVADVAAYTPVTVDVKLHRAMVVDGQLLDKVTGKPVKGRAFYLLLESPRIEPFLAANPAYSMEYSITPTGERADTDDEGRFKLRIPPYPGVILARAATDRDPTARYTACRVAEADRKYLYQRPKKTDGIIEVGPLSDPKEDLFNTHHLIYPVRWENGYALVHPSVTETTLKVSIGFDPGRTITGKIVDPESHPLAGVKAVRVQATDERDPTRLPTENFTAYAFEPGQTRTLYFWHEPKNLVGTATLRGGQAESPVVKLQPAATILGRVLDAAGKPLAGMEISFQLANAEPDEAIRQKLHRSEPTRTVTDKEGRFQLTGMFPGFAFTVFATKPGHRSTAIVFGPVTPKAGEVRDLGEQRLPNPRKSDE
jgi:RNA polymerase sigma factor (sigma-70 family)